MSASKKCCHPPKKKQELPLCNIFTSWWFQNGFIFPNFRVQNKTYLKPPPSSPFLADFKFLLIHAYVTDMTRPSFHLKYRDKRPIMCSFFVSPFLMCVYMEKNLENVEKKWDILPYSFDQFGIRQKPSPTKNLSNPHLKRSAPASMWIFCKQKWGPRNKERQGCWLGYHMCMFFLREQPVIFFQIWKCFR